MSNEHSELSTPVTQVVELEDVVTDKLAQSSDAVADDGGPERAHNELRRTRICLRFISNQYDDVNEPQVSDVHLLGDVW